VYGSVFTPADRPFRFPVRVHEDVEPHSHLTEEEQRVLADAVWRLDNVEFTTVGIDIGSSTSHLMFSRVHLRRKAHQLTSRFVVIERKTLWSSPILFTPFAGAKIETAPLRAFIDDAYAQAGISRDDVDTGAVILTGEAIKRENAAAIATLFASEAGKFVCASAGHHLECRLAAHGSGAVALSEKTGRTVLNADVGGGTTKLALCIDGHVVSTCAFASGGRLITHDTKGRLTRLDDPARIVADSLDADLRVGMKPRKGVLAEIVDVFAGITLEYLRRETPSPLGRALLLTEVLSGPPAEIIAFSGGIAEYIYGREDTDFGDIAKPLAEGIRARLPALGLELADPGAGIRATAIGVSQFTVQVSGRTIHLSDVDLPLYNVPVATPHFTNGDVIDPVRVASAVAEARSTLDLEPAAALALALRFDGSPTYPRLRGLAQGIADAFTGSGEAPLILMFDNDVGLSLGRLLEREFKLDRKLLCIDGLELKEFDYVDIGKPVELARGLPVIIKSLLFGR